MSKKTNLRKLVYSAAIITAVVLFLLYQNSLEKEDTSAEVLNIVENPVSKYTQCRNDNDCVRVRKGPCGCSNGGKAAAINKRYARQYEVLNRQGSCIDAISDHLTCTSPVKCIDSYCTIKTD